MSKLIFTLCLAFASFLSFDASALNIDITLTSKDGCKFRIQGELDLTWTGGFEGFIGKVTVSGGGDCPNGTWTFGMISDNPGGGNGSVDPPRNGRAFRFIGNNPFIEIIKKEPQTLNKMIIKMEHAN